MKIMTMSELVSFLSQPGIKIVMPQFERTDGVVPVQPDGGELWFDQLKGLPHETLEAIGMGVWEKGHYLYPAEWFDFIPDGYSVIDIFGVEKPFNRDNASNDTRYGMLAFGFRTAEWSPDHDDVLCDAEIASPSN